MNSTYWAKQDVFDMLTTALVGVIVWAPAYVNAFAPCNAIVMNSFDNVRYTICNTQTREVSSAKIQATKLDMSAGLFGEKDSSKQSKTKPRPSSDTVRKETKIPQREFTTDVLRGIPYHFELSRIEKLTRCLPLLLFLPLFWLIAGMAGLY